MSLSATYSIHLSINPVFIPIIAHGIDSLINSFSIETASFIISYMTSLDNLLFKSLYKHTAKSVCKPSSLLINSLLKVNPGIRPLFFNQKIAQNEPEKKIPSTAANAITRVAKDDSSSLIQRFAQSAFLRIQGIDSRALNNLFLREY